MGDIAISKNVQDCWSGGGDPGKVVMRCENSAEKGKGLRGVICNERTPVNTILGRDQAGVKIGGRKTERTDRKSVLGGGCRDPGISRGGRGSAKGVQHLGHHEKRS